MQQSTLLSALVLCTGLLALPACSETRNTESMSDEMHKTTLSSEATAIFAGGCFWCVEADFEKVPGVIEAISGYTGGHLNNPSYHQVSAGGTGHVEAVEVHYDPDKVSYTQLLDAFWRHIDPTDRDGQFVDRGNQYRPVIYVANKDQRMQAELSRQQLQQSHQFNSDIRTDIVEASKFWPAEEYHQDYYRKNPIRYTFYRFNSGRDQFIEKSWPESVADSRNRMEAGESKMKSADPMQTTSMSKPTKEGHMMKTEFSKPSKQELKASLSPMQFQVTQKEGTEPPFKNEYWDEKREGIYVDIVSGEALFSSKDKFDSGTGWPSFSRPLAAEAITEKKDFKLIWPRTEVRSRLADSHLGHVFNDGPAPTGMRYCINSAALRFVPKEQMSEQGYGEWLKSI